jgi:S1-C subfamily serine protease
MNRLDFIIELKNHVAYLRPRHDPPEPYEHNRLGAVFVPLDKTSEILTARVIPGTPAYEAGLRNGDILLTLNDYPAGNWSSPRGVGVPDFQLPERTNINLTYARGNKTYRAHAWLRDIIGPGSPGYQAGNSGAADK